MFSIYLFSLSIRVSLYLINVLYNYASIIYFVFESALLDSILKLAVIPVACAPFPTQILPSSQLCI